MATIIASDDTPSSEDQFGEPDFALGDIVETIKGAKFWGRITAIEGEDEPNRGALVRAYAPGFDGVKHVYPLKQLAHRAAESQT